MQTSYLCASIWSSTWITVWWGKCFPDSLKVTKIWSCESHIIKLALKVVLHIQLGIGDRKGPERLHLEGSAVEIVLNWSKPDGIWFWWYSGWFWNGLKLDAFLNLVCVTIKVVLKRTKVNEFWMVVWLNIALMAYQSQNESLNLLSLFPLDMIGG